MDKRTFSYISGRFRDYYRNEEISLPPESDSREWGFIPFEESGDMYMIRHKSTKQMGEIDEFTKRKSPRHFYFSASKYENPSIPNMNDKGWVGADLIFDIDADHLKNVDEDTTPYDEMLAEGKSVLKNLVSVLENDFSFDDITIVFSGGRGYHVHVRDDSVQTLSRSARNEIVDYLTGTNVDFETVTTTYPFEIPVKHYDGLFPKSKGWGSKYRDYLLSTFDEMHTDILNIVEQHKEDTVVTKTTQLLKDKYDINNIGTKRSEAVVSVFTSEETYSEVKLGNIQASPAIKIIAEQLLDQAIEHNQLEIDEPVTTDVNRLIRLPGSLHGGSGMRVSRIKKSNIDDFTPLVDAIPEKFKNNSVKIEVENSVESYIGGEKTEYQPGEHMVPEYEAIHLICQEKAQKLSE